jgi:hypothetical protein
VTIKMIRGRLVVSSPFCSGKREDKSFRAHHWLPTDSTYREFFCPVCRTTGGV